MFKLPCISLRNNYATCIYSAFTFILRGRGKYPYLNTNLDQNLLCSMTLKIYILGSSNAREIEKTLPIHNGFLNSNITIENLAESGGTAKVRAQKSVAKQFPYPCTPNEHFVIWIGANGFGNKNYKNFIHHYYQTVVRIKRITYCKNHQLTVVSPMPRGRSTKTHEDQMKQVEKLINRLRKEGIFVIDSYLSLTERLKDPNEMFGISDRSLARYIHYSRPVRQIIHRALGHRLNNLVNRTVDQSISNLLL